MRQVPVIIATRWRQDDVSGRLLDREPENWKVLCFPALAEENDDLGRQPGEVLWPERHPVHVLETIRK